MFCTKPITYGLAALFLAANAGAALAQQRHRSGSPRTGLSALDKDYLKDAAQSNLEEVQFAPVVAQKALESADKQFGQRMKSDHARANRELKSLASRLGYALPTEVSDEQKAIMQRLSKFQGAEFDAAYKQEMIRDHTQDIAEAKREISLGRNPLVKANARKTLTLLQMHLAMSRALPRGRP